MRYNKLMKTASALLTTVMTLGLFAFVAPAKDVKADDTYDFSNCKDWPWANTVYQSATIDGVEWCAINSGNFADFGSALPSLKQEYGNITHFVLYAQNPNEQTVFLNNTLSLEGSAADITLNLNGLNIYMQTNSQMLNLSSGAKYHIINSSENRSTIGLKYSPTDSLRGGENGGLIAVNGGSEFELSNTNIANAVAYSESDVAKGGAVYVAPGGTVNVSNCNLTKCNAVNGKGGAFFVDAYGTLNLTNVVFDMVGGITNTVHEGSCIYCSASGNVNLSGSIIATGNYYYNANNKVDYWFESNSHTVISSTTNEFTIGNDDYTKPYNEVFEISGNGAIDKIICGNSSYELKKGTSSSCYISEVERIPEFKGMAAIVNAEENGQYFPLAFKATFEIPKAYQTSEYKVYLKYHYEYNEKPYDTYKIDWASFVSEDDTIDLTIGMSPALLTTEMTWEIKKDGEDPVASGTVEPLTCLKEYITNGDTDTQKIAKDLIVFGVYSEEYLYKTSNLRSQAVELGLISESDLDLDDVSFSTDGFIKEGFTGETNKLSYYGCSLVVDKEGLSIRQYVLFDNGAEVKYGDSLTCVVNKGTAQSITNRTKSNKVGNLFYYVDYQRIRLDELDNKFTFAFSYTEGETTVSDAGSLEYSVLDYMKLAKEKKSNDTKLMNYLLSMYELYSDCKASSKA